MKFTICGNGAIKSFSAYCMIQVFYVCIVVQYLYRFCLPSTTLSRRLLTISSIFPQKLQSPFKYVSAWSRLFTASLILLTTSGRPETKHIGNVYVYIHIYMYFLSEAIAGPVGLRCPPPPTSIRHPTHTPHPHPHPHQHPHTHTSTNTHPTGQQWPLQMAEYSLCLGGNISFWIMLVPHSPTLFRKRGYWLQFDPSLTAFRQKKVGMIDINISNRTSPIEPIWENQDTWHIIRRHYYQIAAAQWWMVHFGTPRDGPIQTPNIGPINEGLISMSAMESHPESLDKIFKAHDISYDGTTTK